MFYRGRAHEERDRVRSCCIMRSFVKAVCAFSQCIFSARARARGTGLSSSAIMVTLIKRRNLARNFRRVNAPWNFPSFSSRHALSATFIPSGFPPPCSRDSRKHHEFFANRDAQVREEKKVARRISPRLRRKMWQALFRDIIPFAPGELETEFPLAATWLIVHLIPICVFPDEKRRVFRAVCELRTGARTRRDSPLVVKATFFHGV